jgi:thiamine kinase-like enzyme
VSRNLLEAVAERWVPGRGGVDIHAVTSGLVNASCRVGRAGCSYALRVAASENLDPGLDRQWECRVLNVAADAGLAPRLHECDVEQGIIVSDWVDGRVWSAAEVRESGNLDAMAALLRQVHALSIPGPARMMTVDRWIAHYAGAAARLRAEIPATVFELQGVATARLDELAGLERPTPVLCHSDLHRHNVLVRDPGRGPLLLDWEYAHVSDGFWDLAGWAANNDWTPVDADRLLRSYLGRAPRPTEWLRLSLLGWLYDYVCLLWSVVYLKQRPDGDAATVRDRMDCIAERLVRWSRRVTSGTLADSSDTPAAGTI